MPVKSEPELQIKTSMKNAGAIIKTIAAALGALGLGAAGSVLTSSSSASAHEARVNALEENCRRYDVRISTAETRLEGYQANMIEVRKDLAEIRSTNTQILFLLRESR